MSEELILKTDGLQINPKTLTDSRKQKASFEVRSGECIALLVTRRERENHICLASLGLLLAVSASLGASPGSTVLPFRLILPSFPSRAGRCMLTQQPMEALTL